MIKIDWTQFVYDHVWFGYYVDCHPNEGWCKEDWSSRPTQWHDRLWPVRRYGQPYPTWWFILWGILVERDENGKLIND